MASIRQQMLQHSDQMAKARRWSQETTKAKFEKAMKDIYKEKLVEYNCHPLKIGAPGILQIPIWISVSLAIRKMTCLMTENPTENDLLRFSQFQNDGVLWLPDLTLADPTVLLPVAVVTLFLANIELSANRYKAISGRFEGAIFMLLRGLAFWVGYSASVMPAGMGLYWTASSLTGLLTNLVLMSPRFQALVRIPATKMTKPNPYRFAAANFVERYARLGRKITGKKV